MEGLAITNKMRVLTFEGIGSGAIYDMTVKIKNANLVLINSRLDLETATPPKVVVLQIGSTVNNDFVIDNDDANNFFRYSVRHNPQTVGGAGTNVSQYKPMIGYRMNGELPRRVEFSIRDESTGAKLADALVTHFFFQFQVIE